MQAILAVFRGEATLAAAPEQVFDAATPTTTPATTPPTPTPTTEAPSDDREPSVTTLPSVTAEENIVGVAPSRELVCD